MPYPSLEAALLDLERHGMLLRIREEVSPDLLMPKMAEISTKESMPALLFECVKGSPFRAAANIFGTTERARFLFRKTWQKAETAIAFHTDPLSILKRPESLLALPGIGLSAAPRKSLSAPVLAQTTTLDRLPQIRLHREDGGAFLTLPQVFSQMPGESNILKSNLGMYRIQISGNDYIPNQECGLHYQIERDIARHHEAALKKNEPLKISIWLGGPPAHTLAAIMPMPPELSELTFAGLLGGRAFRYRDLKGWKVSSDADFCILGEVAPHLKPEGPFGDHLGYYSARHEFPYLRVKKVFCKKDAIFPFTTVGRPPQEDSVFGELIGELVRPVVPASVAGICEMNSVDAAGVHPLLLAIGKERYTPYLPEREPMELLKEANALLGFNQVSLSKYLFIAAREDAERLDTRNIVDYFIHVLERVHLDRDIHFQTETTIDTLDYSGRKLNHGSKVIIASVGRPIRELGRSPDDGLSTISLPQGFSSPHIVLPGVLVIQGSSQANVEALAEALSRWDFRERFPLVTVADDAPFTARTLDNWLWITFTRSDPAQDIYGANSRYTQKHWGCNAPLVIDARTKPRLQKVVEEDPALEARAKDILWKAMKQRR